MNILLPVQKILIFPGPLGIFSWNFGNINIIFITKKFLQPLVENIKYTRMIKLQFLNTTHNLLAMFHMKKIGTSFY